MLNMLHRGSIKNTLGHALLLCQRMIALSHRSYLQNKHLLLRMHPLSIDYIIAQFLFTSFQIVCEKLRKIGT